MKVIKMSLIGFMMSACAMQATAAGGFTLRGTIPSTPDSVKVTLYNIEGEKSARIADGYVVNGVFELKGELSSPTMCNLSFATRMKDGRYRNRSTTKMMLENVGDITVEVTVSLDSLGNSYQPELLTKVTAGEAQKQYEEYYHTVKDAELKARKAGFLTAQKWFDTNNNRDTMVIYETLEKQAEEEYQKARFAFVKANPRSHASAYEVFNELRNIFTHDAATLKDLANTVQVCPDTARVSGINRRLEWSLKYCMGMQFPDFSMTSPEGEVKKLSEAMAPGKYTFIDFWASWCGPCRGAIPHVRELHKKYADRLNIFSVSVDEEESDWRGAMDEEKMEWAQYHLKGEQLGNAAQAYFINAIPRLILINDKGEIICSTNKPDDVTAMLQKHLD